MKKHFSNHHFYMEVQIIDRSFYVNLIQLGGGRALSISYSEGVTLHILSNFLITDDRELKLYM